MKKHHGLTRKNTLVRANTNAGYLNSPRGGILDSIQLIRMFLQLPQSARSIYIQQIISLTSHLKFFRNLEQQKSPQAINECWKHCQYQFFPAGRTVIKQGELGNNFYIILSGQVKITRKQNLTHYIDRGVLGTGESFGQRALMLGLVRNASIQTITDCHFASLDKAHYTKVLDAIFNQNFKSLAKLLRRIPTLKGVSKHMMQRVCYHFEKKTFTKKHVLYTEGANVNNVYIILQGQIRLMKKVSMKNKLSLQQKKVSKDCYVASLSQGEILGDYQVASNQDYRAFTAICHTDVAVFAISKQNFLKNILIGDQAEHIKAQMCLKQSHRMKLVKSNKHLIKIKQGLIKHTPVKRKRGYLRLSHRIVRKNPPESLILSPTEQITKKRNIFSQTSISQQILYRKSGINTKKSFLSKIQAPINISSYTPQPSYNL